MKPNAPRTFTLSVPTPTYPSKPVPQAPRLPPTTPSRPLPIWLPGFSVN